MFKIILLYFISIILVGVQVVTCQPTLLTNPDVLIDGESANITCSKDDPLYFIERIVDGVTTLIASCSVTSTAGCIVSNTNLRSVYTVYKTSTSVTIYIASVSRQRDSGKWICRDFLETEKVEKDIDVKVPVNSVTVIRNGSEFRDGSLTSVTCRITGTPHPSANITWFIANRKLADTSNPLQYEARKSDNGKRLKCSATNGYGGSQSNYLMLDIKYTVSYVDFININSLTLNVGQKKAVTCQADGNPLPIITWSINGKQLSTSPNGRLSSTYEYTANKLDNGGYLQCSATNGIDGGAIPDSVRMDIRYSPVLHIDTSSPYNIIEGRQLVLKCIVSDSNPLVTVGGYKWLKNNVAVSGQSSSEYIIPSTLKSGSGTYICTARNVVGSTNSTTVIINVLYGPTVTVTPERLTVKENSIINLTCSAQSNPSVNSIKWHKPDGTIASTANLIISRINRNQAGDYMCQATNILNPTDPSGHTESRTDSKTVAVNVQYLDPMNININKTKVEEGDTINITCITQSNPVALITWFNGDDIIQRINPNEGSYVIERASCLDTSVYRCNATNDVFTNGYTNMTTVLVHCSPRQDTRNTPVTKVTGNISDVVNLVADVISYPQPSFTWYYKDNVVVPISNSTDYQQRNTNSSINTYKSTLQINITSSDFYQTYSVNISNDDKKFTILVYSLNAQCESEEYSKRRTSGISSGIGIGIGISVGVVLLVLVALFVYRRLIIGKQKGINADENYSTLNRGTTSGEPQTYQELNDIRTYENLGRDTNRGEPQTYQELNDVRTYENLGRGTITDSPYANT